MSLRYREVQPEFFSSPEKKRRDQGAGPLSDSMLKRELLFEMSPDRLVISLVVAVMINVICFAWGMERGKVIALRKQNSSGGTFRAEQPVSKMEHAVVRLPAQSAVSAGTESDASVHADTADLSSEPVVDHSVPPATVVQEDPALKTSGYAIQLASYRTIKSVNAELERLKNQGTDSFFLKKGDYFVIYSGIYSEKSAAQRNLPVFRKRYKDCLVRLLKS